MMLLLSAENAADVVVACRNVKRISSTGAGKVKHTHLSYILSVIPTRISIRDPIPSSNSVRLVGGSVGVCVCVGS